MITICICSDIKEDVNETLQIGKDFSSSELRLSEDTIHECDRNFLNGIAHVLSSHNDFHLEDVASTFNRFECLLKDVLLVEAERPGQVRSLRS